MVLLSKRKGLTMRKSRAFSPCKLRRSFAVVVEIDIHKCLHIRRHRHHTPYADDLNKGAATQRGGNSNSLRPYLSPSQPLAPLKTNATVQSGLGRDRTEHGFPRSTRYRGEIAGHLVNQRPSQRRHQDRLFGIAVQAEIVGFFNRHFRQLLLQPFH